MNFTELKAELAARGFDYLSSTRQGQYINWARAELDDVELWPYRISQSTFTAPSSTITDLGPIVSVHDDTTLTPLRFVDYGSYTQQTADLTLTGSPTFYTLTSSTTVAVRPLNSADSLTVRYYRIPPDLTGTDTPLSPSRFHGLLVDMAVQRAYRDADNQDAANALQVEIERQLMLMRGSLLLPAVDGPQDFIQQRAGW